tara:strand:- start:516 stop:740 length:225 start_codon:yes stop_codon:yes gene_type:complete
MEAKDQNKLRIKAEIMLDKANELIRFIRMNEVTALVIKKHGALLVFTHIRRMTHSINRRNIIIDALKSDLSCIM